MDRLQRARELIAYGNPQEIFSFVVDCLEAGDLPAMTAVQMMYEDMYDGFTFNYEIKAPAGLALLYWGKQGINALFEAAQRTPCSKNISIAIDLLATTGTASGRFLLGSHLLNPAVVDLILTNAQKDPEVREYARQRLFDLILALPSDDDAADAASSGLSHLSFRGVDAAKLVFVALAGRWLAIGEPTLNEFRTLISDHPADESRFQTFLEAVPQLLDPTAFEVWPRPDLHGAKEPDFVVRRSDNTYLIVEIETPAKQIITERNQLSAAATQAISQATHYRRFMLDRALEMRNHFPEFQDPGCLVVIGMEEALTDSQRAALAADNQSRGWLKVVGFDSLIRRAIAIRKNTLSRVASVRRIRVV